MAAQSVTVATSKRSSYRALSAAEFPFVATIPARFSDLDLLRHVNNVAVAAIIAEGRTSFLRELFAKVERPSGLRFVVGQTAISFLAEAHYPGAFEIGTGVLSLGRSSVHLAHGFFQDSRCTSVGETILVATAGSGTQPIGLCLRAALTQLTIDESRFASQLRGDG